ncbi:MAG: TonB-dependent receptor [Rhizomicrobium sp.]
MCRPAVAQTDPAPAAASPGEQLETVIVTAQKREQNLQDVPIAITALTTEQLQERHINNTKDLTGVVPGLQIKAGDASASPQIYLRGVGSNDFNPTSNNSVGIYVDGVYLGSPLSQMAQFYDLERVEVLKGPQGTLFGRNTTAGAISVVSKGPTRDFETDASVEYGNYNSVVLEGGIGGPISDELAFRVAGTFDRNDGYTLNTYTGNRVNNINRWAGRAELLYTPSDDLNILFQVHNSENSSGSIKGQMRPLDPHTAAATGADGLCKPGYYYSGQCTNALGYADLDGSPFVGAYDLDGNDNVTSIGGSATANWDLGEVSLVSITAVELTTRNNWEDTDDSPLNQLEINYLARDNEYSEELRLQSNTDQPLTWVAGLYYGYDHLNTNSNIDYYDTVWLGYPYSQNTNTYAIFGQADYKITDKLTVTGGFRYSYDHKSFDYSSNYNFGALDLFTTNQKKGFGGPSARFGLNYEFEPDQRVYATYNRGYKSGGFFGGYAGDLSQVAPYQNETVNAYEVGYKGMFLDDTLRFNAAAFYYDYQDMQVYTMVQETGPLGPVDEQVLDNAGAAEIYGAEFEVEARPIKNLTLNAGVALLHARYTQYRSALASSDYTGNTLPSSPEFSFTAQANYVADLNNGDALLFEADSTYRTKQFSDTADTTRLASGPVFLLNGEIGYRFPGQKVELGVWGRNVLNKIYFEKANSMAGDGFDALIYGAPRTFGVFLRFND